MANILIDMGHPSDIHLFRNAARVWMKAGHHVHYTVLDREMLVELSQKQGLSYDVVYRRKQGRLWLLHEVPTRIWRTWKVAQRENIDLFVGVPSPTLGIPAFLTRKPYLAMTDTEPAHHQLAPVLPFISILLTPHVYYHDVGKKQHRYRGYKEHAYLRPEIFTPDPSVLSQLGIQPGETYFVVRFVAWNATHDIGEHGLTMADKRAVIAILAQYGKIIISAEDDVPHEFRHHIVDYPSDRMHDLLAFAAMYIGEGNTMASEAAVLGTPSIRANTMDLGYCRDLQQRGLMFQLLDGKAIIDKIKAIMASDHCEDTFGERRANMLAQSVSVTDIIVEEGRRLLGE